MPLFLCSNETAYFIIRAKSRRKAIDLLLELGYEPSVCREILLPRDEETVIILEKKKAA